MKFEIKCRWTAKTLFECEATSLKVAVEKAVWARANLTGANLVGAYLADANLTGADLACANLTGADLTDAYLARAYLADADLARADLADADLAGADLAGAKGVEPEKLLHLFQIPQEGELIVWGKKAGVIVKMRVPPEAKRTGNIKNRKCRAEWVEVLDVEGAKTTTVKNCYAETIYKRGATVKPHAYDGNVLDDCLPGIHFFLTRQEAERWT